MARLLVIDDDNTLRQLMAMTLEKAGHHVMQAASGPEAVARFSEQVPDLVVTDILMPTDSLLDVIMLRRTYPAVPFIVVSGLHPQSVQAREVVQFLGARRIVPKPFRLSELRLAANEVLAESAAAAPDPDRPL